MPQFQEMVKPTKCNSTLLIDKNKNPLEKKKQTKKNKSNNIHNNIHNNLSNYQVSNIS